MRGKGALVFRKKILNRAAVIIKTLKDIASPLAQAGIPYMVTGGQATLQYNTIFQVGLLP